jgi:hypothetical protein
MLQELGRNKIKPLVIETPSKEEISKLLKVINTDVKKGLSKILPEDEDFKKQLESEQDNSALDSYDSLCETIISVARFNDYNLYISLNIFEDLNDAFDIVPIVSLMKVDKHFTKIKLIDPIEMGKNLKEMMVTFMSNFLTKNISDNGNL